MATVTACAGDQANALEPHALGTISQNAISQNAISQNAISQNAISQNAISQNAISQNALSSAVMADGRLALDTGNIDVSTELARMLIRYIARCALDGDDILVATVDGQEYEFPGLLGVAPQWLEQPLSGGQERAVSACLLAHVNVYGVAVNMSVRGLGLSLAAGEAERYPWYEATYFGNLFAANQKKYVCSGDAAPDFDAGYPHPAGDRVLRRCSDSESLDSNETLCGFTYVGACADTCMFKADGSIKKCVVNGQKYRQTASVWVLSYDDPDTALTAGLYDQYFGD